MFKFIAWQPTFNDEANEFINEEMSIQDWRTRNKSLFRTIAVLLVFTFLIYDITWAQGTEPVLKVSQNIQIPYAQGKLTSFNTAESDETIINIQDAHSSLDAQYSIANILSTLTTKYDLKVVALEGGQGPIDTSLLKTFPNEKIKKDIADQMMADGVMSAGEFFSIVSGKDVKLYGIEDDAIYQENLNAFKSIIGKSSESLVNVDKLIRVVKALEPKVYSKDLCELVNISHEHEDGKLSFVKYWTDLQDMMKRYKIETDASENLAKLLKTVELEKKIDFSRANQERKELINELSKILPKDKLEKLVVNSVEYKSGKISQAFFHDLLLSLAAEYNISIPLYKNLQAYAEYVKIYESIDVALLFSEFKDLELRTVAALAKTKEQSDLYSISKGLGLLKKLYLVNLTEEDYVYIKENPSVLDRERISDFIKINYEKYALSFDTSYDMDAVFVGIADALKFYEIASKRNNIMFQRTLKAMRKNGQKIAALVTGGFHSKGLAELMKGDKISHLVIMPTFDSGKERPYFTILTNKKQPYEDMIKKGDYTLAVKPVFDNPDPSVVLGNTVEAYARVLMGTLGGARNKENTEKLRRDIITHYIDYSTQFDMMTETIAMSGETDRRAVTPKIFAEIFGVDVTRVASLKRDSKTGNIIFPESTYYVVNESVAKLSMRRVKLDGKIGIFVKFPVGDKWFKWFLTRDQEDDKYEKTEVTDIIEERILEQNKPITVKKERSVNEGLSLTDIINDTGLTGSIVERACDKVLESIDAGTIIAQGIENEDVEVLLLSAFCDSIKLKVVGLGMTPENIYQAIPGTKRSEIVLLMKTRLKNMIAQRLPQMPEQDTRRTFLKKILGAMTAAVIVSRTAASSEEYEQKWVGYNEAIPQGVIFGKPVVIIANASCGERWIKYPLIDSATNTEVGRRVVRVLPGVIYNYETRLYRRRNVWTDMKTFPPHNRTSLRTEKFLEDPRTVDAVAKIMDVLKKHYPKEMSTMPLTDRRWREIWVGICEIHRHDEYLALGHLRSLPVFIDRIITRLKEVNEGKGLDKKGLEVFGLLVQMHPERNHNGLMILPERFGTLLYDSITFDEAHQIKTNLRGLPEILMLADYFQSHLQYARISDPNNFMAILGAAEDTVNDTNDFGRFPGYHNLVRTIMDGHDYIFKGLPLNTFGSEKREMSKKIRDLAKNMELASLNGNKESALRIAAELQILKKEYDVTFNFDEAAITRYEDAYLEYQFELYKMSRSWINKGFRLDNDVAAALMFAAMVEPASEIMRSYPGEQEKKSIENEKRLSKIVRLFWNWRYAPKSVFGWAKNSVETPVEYHQRVKHNLYQVLECLMDFITAQGLSYDELKAITPYLNSPEGTSLSSVMNNLFGRFEDLSDVELAERIQGLIMDRMLFILKGDKELSDIQKSILRLDFFIEKIGVIELLKLSRLMNAARGLGLYNRLWILPTTENMRQSLMAAATGRFEEVKSYISKVNSHNKTKIEFVNAVRKSIADAGLTNDKKESASALFEELLASTDRISKDMFLANLTLLKYLTVTQKMNDMVPDIDTTAYYVKNMQTVPTPVRQNDGKVRYLSIIYRNHPFLDPEIRAKADKELDYILAELRKPIAERKIPQEMLSSINRALTDETNVNSYVISNDAKGERKYKSISPVISADLRHKNVYVSFRESEDASEIWEVPNLIPSINLRTGEINAEHPAYYLENLDGVSVKRPYKGAGLKQKAKNVITKIVVFIAALLPGAAMTSETVHDAKTPNNEFISSSGASFFTPSYESSIGTENGIEEHFSDVTNALRSYPGGSVRLLYIMGSKSAGLKYDGKGMPYFKDRKDAIADFVASIRAAKLANKRASIVFVNYDIVEYHPDVVIKPDIRKAFIKLMKDFIRDGFKELNDEEKAFIESVEFCNEHDYISEFAKIAGKKKTKISENDVISFYKEGSAAISEVTGKPVAASVRTIVLKKSLLNIKDTLKPGVRVGLHQYFYGLDTTLTDEKLAPIIENAIRADFKIIEELELPAGVIFGYDEVPGNIKDRHIENLVTDAIISVRNENMAKNKPCPSWVRFWRDYGEKQEYLPDNVAVKRGFDNIKSGKKASFKETVPETKTGYADGQVLYPDAENVMSRLKEAALSTGTTANKKSREGESKGLILHSAKGGNLFFHAYDNFATSQNGMRMFLSSDNPNDTVVIKGKKYYVWSITEIPQSNISRDPKNNINIADFETLPITRKVVNLKVSSDHRAFPDDKKQKPEEYALIYYTADSKKRCTSYVHPSVPENMKGVWYVETKDETGEFRLTEEAKDVKIDPKTNAVTEIKDIKCQYIREPGAKMIRKVENGVKEVYFYDRHVYDMFGKWVMSGLQDEFGNYFDVGWDNPDKPTKQYTRNSYGDQFEAPIDPVNMKVGRAERKIIGAEFKTGGKVDITAAKTVEFYNNDDQTFKNGALLKDLYGKEFTVPEKSLKIITTRPSSVSQEIRIKDGKDNVIARGWLDEKGNEVYLTNVDALKFYDTVISPMLLSAANKNIPIVVLNKNNSQDIEKAGWWAERFIRGDYSKKPVRNEDLEKFNAIVSKIKGWAELQNTADYVLTHDDYALDTRRQPDQAYLLLYSTAKSILDGGLTDDEAKGLLTEQLEIVRKVHKFISGETTKEELKTEKKQDLNAMKRILDSAKDFSIRQNKPIGLGIITLIVSGLLMRWLIKRHRRGPPAPTIDKMSSPVIIPTPVAIPAPAPAPVTSQASSIPPVVPPVAAAAPAQGYNGPTKDFYEKQIAYCASFLTDMQNTIQSKVTDALALDPEQTSFFKRFLMIFSNFSYAFKTDDQITIANSIVNACTAVRVNVNDCSTLENIIKTMVPNDRIALENVFSSIADFLDAKNENSVVFLSSEIMNRERMDGKVKSAADRQNDTNNLINAATELMQKIAEVRRIYAFYNIPTADIDAMLQVLNNFINGTGQLNDIVKNVNLLSQKFFFANAGIGIVENLSFQQSFGAPGHYLKKRILHKDLIAVLDIGEKEARAVLNSQTEGDRSIKFAKYYADPKQKFAYTRPYTRQRLVVCGRNFVELAIRNDSGRVIWEGTTLLGLPGRTNTQDAEEGVEFYSQGNGRQMTTFENTITIINGYSQRLKTAAEVGSRLADQMPGNTYPELGDVVTAVAAPLREAIGERYVKHTEHLGDDSSREPVLSRLGFRVGWLTVIVGLALFVFGAWIFPNLPTDIFQSVYETKAVGIIKADETFSIPGGLFFVAKFLITVVFFTVTITMIQKRYLSRQGLFNRSGTTKTTDDDIANTVPNRKMAEAVEKLAAENILHFDNIKTHDAHGNTLSSQRIVKQLERKTNIIEGFLEDSKKPMNQLRLRGQDGADPFFFIYMDSISRKELCDAILRISFINDPDFAVLKQRIEALQTAGYLLNNRKVYNNKDIIDLIETIITPFNADRVYQALRSDKTLYIHIGRCTPIFGEEFMLETVNVRNLYTDYPNLTVWPALVEHDQSVTNKFTQLVADGNIPDGVYAFLSTQMGSQKQNLEPIVTEAARQAIANGQPIDHLSFVSVQNKAIKRGFDLIVAMPETKSVATGYDIAAMETLAEILHTTRANATGVINKMVALSDNMRRKYGIAADKGLILGLPDFSQSSTPEVFEILDIEDRANKLQPWNIAIGFKKIQTIVSYLQDVIKNEPDNANKYDAIRPANLRKNHRELYDAAMRWGIDLLMVRSLIKQFKSLETRMAKAASSNKYIHDQMDFFYQALRNSPGRDNLEKFVLSEMMTRMTPAVLQGILRLNPIGDNRLTTQDYGPWRMIKRGLTSQRSVLSLFAGMAGEIALAYLGYHTFLTMTGSTFWAFVGIGIGDFIGYNLIFFIAQWGILKIRHWSEYIEMFINKASPFPYDGTTNSFWLEKLVGRNMKSGEATFRGILEDELFEYKKGLYDILNNPASLPNDIRDAREALNFMANFMPLKTLGIHDSSDIIEDAKLGSLCSRYGYRNMIMENFAAETFEANLPELGYDWWYQRSRWITITPIAVMLRHIPDFGAFFGAIIGMGFGGALIGSRTTILLGISAVIGGFAIGSIAGFILGWAINHYLKKRGLLKYPEQDSSFILQSGAHNFFQLIFLLFGTPSTVMTAMTFASTGLLAGVVLLSKIGYMSALTGGVMSFTPPVFWFIASLGAGIAIFLAPSLVIYEMSVFGALFSKVDNESLVKDGLDRMKETAEKFQNVRIARAIKKLSGIIKYNPTVQADILAQAAEVERLIFEMCDPADTVEWRNRKVFDSYFMDKTTGTMKFKLQAVIEGIRGNIADPAQLATYRARLNQLQREKSSSINKFMSDSRVKPLAEIDSILNKYALDGNYTLQDFLGKIKNTKATKFLEEVQAAKPVTLDAAIALYDFELGLLETGISNKVLDIGRRYREVTEGRVRLGWKSLVTGVSSLGLGIWFGIAGLVSPVTAFILCGVGVVCLGAWLLHQFGIKLKTTMMFNFYFEQVGNSIDIAFTYFLHMIPSTKITVEQLIFRRDDWWSRTSHDETEVLIDNRDSYSEKLSESIKEFISELKPDDATFNPIKQINIFRNERNRMLLPMKRVYKSLFELPLVYTSLLAVSAVSFSLLSYNLFDGGYNNIFVVFFLASTVMVLWNTIIYKFDDIDKYSFFGPSIRMQRLGVILTGVGALSTGLKGLGYFSLFNTPIWLDISILGTGAILIFYTLFTPKETRKAIFVTIYNKLMVPVSILGPAVMILLGYPLYNDLLAQREEAYQKDNIYPLIDELFMIRSSINVDKPTLLWELVNGLPVTKEDKGQIEYLKKIHSLSQSLLELKAKNRTGKTIEAELINAFKQCPYPSGISGLEGWIKWNMDMFALKAAITNGTVNNELVKKHYIDQIKADEEELELLEEKMALDVDKAKTQYVEEQQKFAFHSSRVKMAQLYLDSIRNLEKRQNEGNITMEELLRDFDIIRVQLEAYRQMLLEKYPNDNEAAKGLYGALLGLLDDRLDSVRRTYPWSVPNLERVNFSREFYPRGKWHSEDYLAADPRPGQPRSNAIATDKIVVNERNARVEAHINLDASESNMRSGNIVFDVRSVLGRELSKDEDIIITIEVPSTFVADPLKAISISGIWASKDADGQLLWQHGKPEGIDGKWQMKDGNLIYCVPVRPLPDKLAFNLNYSYRDRGFDSDPANLAVAGIRFTVSDSDKTGKYSGQLTVRCHTHKKTDVNTPLVAPISTDAEAKVSTGEFNSNSGSNVNIDFYGNANEIVEELNALAKSGVRNVKIRSLIGDGSKGLVLDGYGRFIGFDNKFKTEVSKLFEGLKTIRNKHADFKVLIDIFDERIADGKNIEHIAALNNEDSLSKLATGLEDVFGKYWGDPAVFAWVVFDKPDVPNNMTDDAGVSLLSRYYVSNLIEKIAPSIKKANGKIAIASLSRQDITNYWIFMDKVDVLMFYDDGNPIDYPASWITIRQKPIIVIRSDGNFSKNEALLEAYKNNGYIGIFSEQKEKTKVQDPKPVVPQKTVTPSVIKQSLKLEKAKLPAKTFITARKGHQYRKGAVDILGLLRFTSWGSALAVVLLASIKMAGLEKSLNLTIDPVWFYPAAITAIALVSLALIVDIIVYRTMVDNSKDANIKTDKVPSFDTLVAEQDALAKGLKGTINYGSFMECAHAVLKKYSMESDDARMPYANLRRDFLTHCEGKMELARYDLSAQHHLSALVEKGMARVREDKWANGEPVISYEYSEIKEPVTLESGATVNFVTIPGRKAYEEKKRKDKPSTKEVKTEAKGPKLITDHDKKCYFSSLSKQVLFDVMSGSDIYRIFANINPIGYEHILFSTKEPSPQLFESSKLISDMLNFLRVLGAEYTGAFNSPRAAASVYHFHAQFRKGKQTIWNNIDNKATGISIDWDGAYQDGFENVKGGYLKGWPGRYRYYESYDIAQLSEAILVDAKDCLAKDIPYNLLTRVEKDGKIRTLFVPRKEEKTTSLIKTGLSINMGGWEAGADVVQYTDEQMAYVKAHKTTIGKDFENVMNTEICDMSWVSPLSQNSATNGNDSMVIGVIGGDASVLAELNKGLAGAKLVALDKNSTKQAQLAVLRAFSMGQTTVPLLGLVDVTSSENVANQVYKMFDLLEQERIRKNPAMTKQNMEALVFLFSQLRTRAFTDGKQDLTAVERKIVTDGLNKLSSDFRSIRSNQTATLSLYELSFDNIAKLSTITTTIPQLASRKFITQEVSNAGELRDVVIKHINNSKGQKEYPVKLMIKLTDEFKSRLTEHKINAGNIGIMLEKMDISSTDLEKYGVKISWTGAKNLGEVMNELRNIYKDPTIRPADIAVGSLSGFENAERGTTEELKDMLIVTMDKGLASQQYDLMVVMLANNNRLPVSGLYNLESLVLSSCGIDGVVYFKFKAITPIPMEQLQHDMERYENILISA